MSLVRQSNDRRDVPIESGHRHGLAALRCFIMAQVFAGVAICAQPAVAVVLVNDTWQDGERNTPAAPTYSENGTNSDPGEDTDLESVWYRGGGGTLDPVGAGGPLRAVMDANGTSSSSWTTYFTPEASPVTLANPGDQMILKWVFTPTDVNTSNNSQNFRIAVVDSPDTARLADNGSPGAGAYTGYAIFGNMGQNFGRNGPFELRRRTGTGNFLSTSGEWAAVATDGASGNTGFASGTQYTYLFNATRNASSGIDIITSITGGNLDGTGDVTISYTDAAPGSFSFDTFSLRPSNSATSASTFDTSLFRVEFNPPLTNVLAGDYNNNGRVDAADYVVWRKSLVTMTPLLNETASLGMVDQADYDAWRASFGAMSGSGSAVGIPTSHAAVPEPASAALCLIGCVFVAAVRIHGGLHRRFRKRD